MAHTLIGTVVSDKRDKTITVAITFRETHPLYKKQYTRTRKYTAHDEKNEARLGDKVEIKETRPLSSTKNFILVKMLEKAHDRIELKEDETFAKSERPLSQQDAPKDAPKKAPAKSKAEEA